MGTDAAPEYPGLPKTTLGALQDFTGTLGRSLIMVTIFAIPALWVLQTTLPSGVPYGILGFSTIIFITSAHRLGHRAEQEETQDALEALAEKYDLLKVLSLVIVMSVTMYSTVVFIAAGLGVLLAGSWHPVAGVTIAVLVPILDNELSELNPKLAPTVITRLVIYGTIVLFSHLWGEDTISDFEALDPRENAKFYV